MITSQTVAAFPDGIAAVLGGRSVLLLLASKSYLPPSAVSLVSDVRFCRCAQRLARLT
jgi:hypothetical protein